MGFSIKKNYFLEDSLFYSRLSFEMVCIASGMALSSRLRAFHRQIEVFSAFLEIRSASKSAAAFDGAATRTLILIISLIFSF